LRNCALHARGVRVVAISNDPVDVNRAHRQKLGFGFPLLSDEDEQVIKRYGLLHSDEYRGEEISRPANLLLDGQGVIRWATFTDNIRVRPPPDTLLEAAKKLR
jgi:peroxiredoxin